MTSSADSFWDFRNADFSAVNLLVVDDKSLFREVVRATFSDHVKMLHEAASIEQAVDMLAHGGGNISCVVCDWDIRPVGGIELLRMIRCRTLPCTSPRMPFVVLTARAEADAVKSAMELDVNGFAVVPLSMDKLVKTVAGALSRQWVLQSAGHYASVPGIVPPPPPVEKKPVASLFSHRRPALRTPTVGTFKPFARRGTSAALQSIGKGESLKNVRMCILDDVNPGAVLARDLRDREGHVLASSGTELNPMLLERLKNVGYALSDSYYVWVGDR